MKELKGLNAAANKIHAAAKEKGFYDNPKEIGTLLMLCVSELGEALESDRKEAYTDMIGYEKNMCGYSPENNPSTFEFTFENEIKDTFEDEIADTIIRLLDLCGYKNIDIEKHIDLKLKYNRLRSKLHGKNY